MHLAKYRRTVGADRHEGDVYIKKEPKLFKEISVSGIAAEKNRLAVFFKDVRIVTSLEMSLPRIPVSPVNWLEGFYRDAGDFGLLLPVKLDDFFINNVLDRNSTP